MTLEQLKARVYDLLAQQQAIQGEIQRVNQQIANFKEEKEKDAEERTEQ